MVKAIAEDAVTVTVAMPHQDAQFLRLHHGMVLLRFNSVVHGDDIHLVSNMTRASILVAR